MATSVDVNEETTRHITANLVDETGAQILLADLKGLLLTVYDQRTGTLLRPTQPALNLNNVTVVQTTVTQLDWHVRPFETKFVNTKIKAGQGGKETHIALFEWFWNPVDTRTLSGPFATTINSKTVTVTISGHGLVIDDHVAFSGVTNVGGLDLDGLYIVDSVIDPNTVTVSHRTAAGGTSTGGGSPTCWLNPQTNKEEILLRITKMDPT